MWYFPLRHVGAAGPTIRSEVTTPSPTAAAILASTCAWTMRSCVAHAVDLASMVSTPSRKDAGSACAAICSPTTVGHCPNTEPSATLIDQPRARARSDVADPNGWGSRESGPGPDHLLRRPLLTTLRGCCVLLPRPTSLPWVRAASRASSRVR